MDLNDILTTSSGLNWPLLLIPAAIFILFLVANSVVRMLAIKDWPAVEGVITVSRFDYSVQVPLQSQNDRRLIPEEPRVIYYPQVEYHYTVDQQEYTGTRIQYGAVFKSSDPQRVQEKMQDFPVGKSVQVFYNPRNPAESCLRKTVNPL